MQQKPSLPFWSLWNLSFGFFGVQIAFALQSANISRIFATLGADPYSLSYFWIIPPLLGLIVQPIVGTYSDRTWTRFGRRIPYLLVGALVSVLVMIMLPNAGEIRFIVGYALIFGATFLVLLDTAINMAMQPFKMLVGDMVNEKQKSFAYSLQSFLCNAGSLVGYLLPLIFTAWGIANIAPEGVVPDSVKWSFYVGAAILTLCVLYTVFTVKELPPAEYAKYNGITEETAKSEKSNVFVLLKNAPSVFWTVGLVQFFCWAAFMYMWTYTNGAIASSVWSVDTTVSGHATLAEYQQAGNWVGTLFAVQAIGSVLWALVIPRFKNVKTAYIISLLIGAIGFISIKFVPAEAVIFGSLMSGKYILFLSYFLVGFAWAAMLALPFTLLTNVLQGTSKMGTYLGLFNGTICVPQIAAALLGGFFLKYIAGSSQVNMLVLSGIFLILGAVAVLIVKEKK
jgi:maltose/moltooligosaccharide transporter